MRRRMLFGGASGPALKGTVVDKSSTIAGDICAVNSGGEKVFVRITEGSTIVEATPIGVVVIPASHNVYGTGECAIISLNAMSYSTPDTGGKSEQSMYWGSYGVDVSELSNLNKVNIIGVASAQTDTITNTSYAYLPSDTFTGSTCVKDENAKYYNTSSNAIPSPYLTDGSRNPQYYDTSVSNLNALADFNGVENTEILIGLASGQTGWETSETITNSYSGGCFPAACCCWRYSTEGTSQGDWYLPACGELGYVCARRGAINAALTYVIENELVMFCSTVPTYDFWSSIEYSTNDARGVSMSNGSVYYNFKYSLNYVRGFLRV